jgi:hypothetical protein
VGAVGDRSLGTGVWGRDRTAVPVSERIGDRSLGTGVWGQEFGSLGVWGQEFRDRSLGVWEFGSLETHNTNRTRWLRKGGPNGQYFDPRSAF